jgi:hypothetical protein
MANDVRGQKFLIGMSTSNKNEAGQQWLTLVILATQEA